MYKIIIVIWGKTKPLQKMQLHRDVLPWVGCFPCFWDRGTQCGTFPHIPLVGKLGRCRVGHFPFVGDVLALPLENEDTRTSPHEFFPTALEKF
jgi:hypothetical protein